MSTCSRLGGAFAPFLMVPLVAAFASWRLCFVAISLLGVLWGAFFWPWFRNRPEEKAGVNAAEIAYIRAGAPEVEGGHVVAAVGGIDGGVVVGQVGRRRIERDGRGLGEGAPRERQRTGRQAEG